MEKDCYLLCFMLIFTIYLVIKCFKLNNRILSQKETFIEILGHDLRVPVIAQIRGLDLIRKTDNQQYIIEEVYKSCVYTLDMINMLMKIYSIENGDIDLKYENFSLYEILSSILNEFKDVIADKAMEITYNINEMFLFADNETMYKALKILIYIVLQYSDNNSVLNFSVYNSGGNLNLILSYSGRTLSYDEYHRIFYMNPKFSAVGHGIQMYLLKKIIDLHKGKIEFISEKQEKRHSFKISIPQRRNACTQWFWHNMNHRSPHISLQNLI